MLILYPYLFPLTVKIIVKAKFDVKRYSFEGEKAGLVGIEQLSLCHTELLLSKHPKTFIVGGHYYPAC